MTNAGKMTTNKATPLLTSPEADRQVATAALEMGGLDADPARDSAPEVADPVGDQRGRDAAADHQRQGGLRASVARHGAPASATGQTASAGRSSRQARSGRAAGSASPVDVKMIV